MKWYELLQKLPIPQNRKEWYRVYSDSITKLGRLEGAGVKVVEEKFIDSFNFNPAFIYNGHVLTQYNPYTTTGRPSNRHLNVNYSALNKSDGSRDSIISRFEGGTLLQMDYESYHIRLIARLIDYEFPTGITAHQHLANLYGVDYETAKGMTFKYLYGGLDEFAMSIPFFKSVDRYIKGAYQRFIITGRLITPLYKREIHFTKIEGATEQKVFNYLLQALETEVNYIKIGKALDFLSKYKSKLILYTYDAFLIDTHPEEREIILQNLPTLMETGGFPVRTYEGINYGNLVSLS
jgi:DNA polymerase I-like protein with 3'-5' exonuclease and polymerase domains